MILFTNLLITNLLYCTAIDIFLIAFFNINIFFLITNSVFREKFLSFIGVLASVSFCGFYHSFDGFMIFLLSTELVVVVLLLFLSLTTNLANKTSLTQFISLSLLMMISAIIYLFSLTEDSVSFTITIKFIYSTINDIYSTDLFVFFHLFFVEYPSFIVFITLLLSLFTIFFVFFYYKVKKLSSGPSPSSETLKVLRFQKSIKQSLFKPQIRSIRTK